MTDIIYRGETKLIEIYSDNSAFPVSNISDLVLTISHGQTDTELTLSDFSLVTNPETNEQTYQHVISQETTLSWDKRFPVKMELDILSTDGTRKHVGKRKFTVEDVKHDEVMT